MSSVDTLRFGEGINTTDIRAVQSGLHLQIVVSGIDADASSEVITFNDYFRNYYYEFDRVEFADDTVWGASDISHALTLVGNSSDNIIDGNANSNRIEGNDGNDVLTGNAGDDVLLGGSGSDTYIFGADSGSDTIVNFDADPASVDIALFEEVSFEDLWFSRNGDNLQITHAGTDDQVIVNNWYNGADYQLDSINTSSSVLLNNQVDQLVSAMATYDVPSGAGNVVPQDIKDQLQTVIAETWQAA
ncbi:MAG: Ca2+-binding RTX toxin-like protein [Psychromonas sp.]